MEKNYKNINLKGEGWSLRAIAMGVPTKDVAISINLKRRLRNSKVRDEELRVKSLIEKWKEESSLLDDRHFIFDIATPTYPHDREVPMVFKMDIAVLTRETIPMGRDNFKEYFTAELESLIDTLGI